MLREERTPVSQPVRSTEAKVLSTPMDVRYRYYRRYYYYLRYTRNE